jgi:hypothetical protein
MKLIAGETPYKKLFSTGLRPVNKRKTVNGVYIDGPSSSIFIN